MMKTRHIIQVSLLILVFTVISTISAFAQNVISNGEFGSSDGWTVLDLGDPGLKLDFNYTADGPTEGSGAGLRLFADSANGHTAIYQAVTVEVGAEYNFTMLLKNLAGAADKQWVEILLTPIEPDGSGFDSETYRIAKVDGWDADCLLAAADFDGDLGTDYCDFGYANNVDNGVLTIASADGETAGDMVQRYFVIKSGICCDGVAPDWVFDNISLEKRVPVTRTSIENGEFGSSDNWTVIGVGDDPLLDVDFNYTADGPTGGSGAGLRISADSASGHIAVYQPLLVEAGAKYDFSMLLKNLAGAADKQWVEILLTSIEPTGSGFDSETYRIAKIDGWDANCLPTASTFDGDLGLDYCDFGYENNVNNGILSIPVGDGEFPGDKVLRYFVIKTGVCCDGVAPDWVYDNIIFKKKSDAVTRTSIENGDFGSSENWTVLDLDAPLNVDFNYTADGPTGGSGASLRLSADSANGHSAIYQPLLVTVGAKYDFSMLLKNLAGAADKQWMEILLTPIEPDGSGFDSETYRIAKVDGWDANCLPTASTFDGDLGLDYCDFGYANNVNNGVLTVPAADGEVDGDIAIRYFVIKSGVCCDGVAPDWAIDNISLKMREPITRKSIENGGFGSSDNWTVLDLADAGLDADFNYTADGPTGGDGAALRLSSSSADVHTAVYQSLIVEAGAKYDFSMLLKNLAGAADKQWMEILLTPIEPDGSGFDSETYRIAKVDGWSTDCLPTAANFDGDIALEYCEFGYSNNVDNGVLTIAKADGEESGDMVERYFVIKTGVCCDGVAPDWVIDNISLEWKSPPDDNPIDPEPNNNIFANGDFSKGAANWSPQNIGATVTFSYDNEEFFANIDAITDQDWNIALWQKPISLEQGKTYRMSFDARATGIKQVTPIAQMNQDPWENPMRKDIMIGTEMKTYSVTWIQDAPNVDYKIGIFLGADIEDVWIDNMVLEEVPNIFVNGSFAAGGESWEPDASNGAAASFSFENEEFFADIQTITDQNWHIALWQKPISLEEGKTYTMSFDARASAVKVVNPKVQMNQGPWESTLDAEIVLDTAMANYSVTWTQNQPTVDYKVGIFLGGSDVDVWIDNMILYEGSVPGAPLGEVTPLTDWVSGLDNPAVAGKKRLMTVFIMGENNSGPFYPTEVTYGSQLMTSQIDTNYAGTSESYTTYAGIFTLDEAGVSAATSGAIDITWDVTPSNGSDVVSVLLGNVNQEMPVSMKTRSAIQDSTASSSPLYANKGDMVAFCGATASQSTTTANNGFIQTFEGESGWGDAIVAYKIGSDAEETPSFNQEKNGRMPIAAVAILKDGNSPAAAYDMIVTAKNGSVLFSPEGPYRNAQTVTATAVADTGYKFFRWSGDIIGSENPIEYIVTGEMNITANFVDENSDLVPWIETFNFADGTTVDTGSSSWTALRNGGFFGTMDSMLVINDDTDDNPVGIFTTGVINIPPESAVDISMDITFSDGLDDPQDYVKLYKIIDSKDTLLIDELHGGTKGDTVVFSQKYIMGSTLELMIRSYVSHESEFYYMDNLSVTESVGPIPTYGVIVYSQNGTIVVDPSGPVLPHTIVTITAVPDSGYEFVEWLGEFNGQPNPMRISMDSQKNVSTIFVPSTNLLKNGDFSQGNANWSGEVNSTAAASFSFENEECYIDIQSVTDQSWHVSLFQHGVPLKPNTKYTLKFDARAAAEKVIAAKAQMDGDPWEGSLEEDVTLTTEMKTYSFTWDQTADAMDYKIGIFAGTDTTNVWIDNIHLAGEEIVAVEDELSNLPTSTELNQNYPNPFNPTTTIKFQMPNNAHVTLSIYNTLGQMVSQLVNREMSAGYHSVNFNASNLSSGIYFYKLEVGSFINVKKMMLLK